MKLIAILLIAAFLPYPIVSSKKRAAAVGGTDPDLLWWKLNDGAGTTITATVGPNGTTDGDLNSDYLALNGSNDDAQSNSTIPYNTGVFTLSFWARSPDWTVAGEHVLFESSDNYGGGPTRFLANIDNAGTTVNLLIYTSGTYRWEYFNAASGPYTLTADTWYHFAFVYDNPAGSGVGDIKAYKDGAEITLTLLGGGSKTDTGNFASEVLHVGARNAAGSFFSGRIDDVRIYTGELNSTQIGNIFAAGRQ